MISFNEWRGKGKKRSLVLTHWQSLNPNSFIKITPKPHNHYGTSMDEDTIRITGSREFIDGVISRLKDIISYESNETELQIKYEPLNYKHAGGMEPNYIFGLSVRYKDPNKKIPKGPLTVLNF